MFFFEPVRGAIGGRSSLGVLGKRGLGVVVAGEFLVFLSFELLLTYVAVGNVGLSGKGVLVQEPPCLWAGGTPRCGETCSSDRFSCSDITVGADLCVRNAAALDSFASATT